MKKRLSEPLPGLSAQLRMAGMRRVIRHGRMQAPSSVKKAGVLALFFPYDNSARLVFIQRNEYRGVHSGQVSFPGGSWEAGDRDLTATALREAEEEIGINQKQVIVIGLLSELYIPPSNFMVTPVVGYTLARPTFIPDPEEVKGILEVPLKDLLDENTIQIKKISIFPGVKWKVPCFYVNETIIWGATAMILNELVEVIRQGSGSHG